MKKLKQICKLVHWKIYGDIKFNYTDLIIRLLCILIISIIQILCISDYIMYSKNHREYIYRFECASISSDCADYLILHYPEQFSEPINIYCGRRVASDVLESGYYSEVYSWCNDLPSNVVYLSSDLYNLVHVFPFDELNNMDYKNYTDTEKHSELFSVHEYVALISESSYVLQSHDVDFLIISFETELSDEELQNIKNYLNTNATVVDIQLINEKNDSDIVNYDSIRMVVVVFSLIGIIIIWAGYLKKRKPEAYSLYVSGIDYLMIGISDFLIMIFMLIIVIGLLILVLSFTKSINTPIIVSAIFVLLIETSSVGIYNLINVKGLHRNV